MVAVVQLVEHQVVILEVAGSSPVTHPTGQRCLCRRLFLVSNPSLIAPITSPFGRLDLGGHTLRIGERMARMVEDTGAAQARALLRALHDHVAEITEKIEVAETRGHRASIRGAAQDRRQHSALRRDLYEAHRLIDGLHRRFPELRMAGCQVADVQKPAARSHRALR